MSPEPSLLTFENIIVLLKEPLTTTGVVERTHVDPLKVG
jgi:hypothetical protein